MTALNSLKSCLLAFGLVWISWPVQSFQNPPRRHHQTGLLNAHSFRTATNFRLPLEVIPTHYVLYIAPQVFDKEASDFLTAHGKVIITATAIQINASIITLNVDFDFITIDQAQVQVREKGGRTLSIRSLIQDQSRMFLGIQLEAGLVLGLDYEIQIQYLAKLSQPKVEGKFAGIFALEDTNPRTNVTSYLAVTHFEPAYARRAFPCFDEPNLKAQFELQIGRKGSYHSLSNMDLKEVHKGADGWVWDVYNPTEIMSTYLVCFAVTEFTYADAPAEIYGKTVKIWTPRHLIDEEAVNFAARSSAKALQYFNSTFGIDYKFPKLDSIAISPFLGGMENWGLVVYDANGLQLGLHKSEIGRSSSCNLIGHQLAHQWFGNLVTCKWWTDLWLNEGFAQYLAYHAENSITPEFEPLERLCLDNNFHVMEYEGIAGSHPLKFGMDHPVDGTLFSGIVYMKGAAVARMMELIFGKELFFNGLRSYLDEMQYQGAEQDDLFRNLQLHVASALPVDITVKDFLDTWTLQAGYPLVRVARANRDRLEFVQEHYCCKSHTNESQPMTWYIPLSISTSSQPNGSRQEWLKQGQFSRVVTGVDADQWIVVNTNAAGYFRVLYEGSLVSSLWEQLNVDHTTFSTATRAMFINDYFTFAAAGIVQVDEAFEFTRYLGEEKQATPWSTFLQHFDQFAQLAQDNSRTRDIATRYLSPRLDGLFEAIGLRESLDASGYSVSLRTDVLMLACPLRYHGCLIYGNEIFEQWKNSGVNLTPWYLRRPLYCGAVAGPNGSDAINYFLNKYMGETDAKHRNVLVSALPCSKSRAEHERLLTLVEDSQSGIQLEDRWELLGRMATEIAGRDLAIGYIQKNLNGTLITPELYHRVIFQLSPHVYQDSVIAQIENHVRMNEEILKDVLVSIRASLMQMRANAEWMKSVGNWGFSWMESNLKE